MVTTRLPSDTDRSLGGRIYAVGDVHGHRDKLASVHALIGQDLAESPAENPILVHLGDYIDRGPDTAGCLSLLAGPPTLPGVQTVNLIGNHEAMLLAALDDRTDRSAQLWLMNGGLPALESWGIDLLLPPTRWAERIPAAHLAFLRGLQFSHAAEGYVFVHAGVRPGVRLAKQRQSDLIWIRDDFLNWSGPMLPEAPQAIVVHGHTPRPEPEVRANRIGLDTGAGHGGKLTCAVLGSGPIRFLQA